MIPIFKNGHLTQNLEIVGLLMVGILLQMMDGSPFTIKERWKVVWDTDLPSKHFNPFVQKCIKTLLSVIVTIRCTTTYAYVVSAMLVVFCIFKRVAPKLMCLWLLVAFIKPGSMIFLEGLIGVYVCSSFGKIRKACVEFFIVKALELIFASYLWGSVLNMYKDIEKELERRRSRREEGLLSKKQDFRRLRARSLIDESTLSKTTYFNNFERRDVPLLILQMLKRDEEMSDDSLLAPGMMLASVSNLGSFDNIKTSQSLGELGFTDLTNAEVFGIEENETLTKEEKVLKFLKLTTSEVRDIILNKSSVENDIYNVDDDIWKRVVSSGLQVNQPKQPRTEIFIRKISPMDLVEEELPLPDRDALPFKSILSVLFNDKKNEDERVDEDDNQDVGSEDEEEDDDLIFMSNLKEGGPINRITVGTSIRKRKGREYANLYKKDSMSEIGPEVFDKASKLPKLTSLSKIRAITSRTLRTSPDVTRKKTKRSKNIEQDISKYQAQEHHVEDKGDTSSAWESLPDGQPLDSVDNLHSRDHKHMISFQEPDNELREFSQMSSESAVPEAKKTTPEDNASPDKKSKDEEAVPVILEHERLSEIKFKDDEAPELKSVGGKSAQLKMAEEKLAELKLVKEKLDELKLVAENEPKLRERKSDEPKSGERKSDEPKSGDGKSDEPKSGDGKSDEPKSGEGKSDEPKPGEKKSDEPKPGEKKSDEPKSGEKKSNESKLKGKEPSEIQPSFGGEETRGNSSKKEERPLAKEPVPVNLPESEDSERAKPGPTQMNRKITIRWVGQGIPKVLSRNRLSGNRSPPHNPDPNKKDSEELSPPSRKDGSSEKPSNSKNHDSVEVKTKKIKGGESKQIYYVPQLFSKPLFDVLSNYYDLKKRIYLKSRVRHQKDKLGYSKLTHGRSRLKEAEKMLKSFGFELKGEKKWKSEVLKRSEPRRKVFPSSPVTFLNVLKKRDTIRKLIVHEYRYLIQKYNRLSRIKMDDNEFSSSDENAETDHSDNSTDTSSDTNASLNVTTDSVESGLLPGFSSTQPDESPSEVLSPTFSELRPSDRLYAVGSDDRTSATDIAKPEEGPSLETRTFHSLVNEEDLLSSQESDEPISLYYSKAANLASPLLDMKGFIYPDHIHYSYKHVKKKGFDVDINGGFPLLMRGSLTMGGTRVKMEHKWEAKNQDCEITRRPMDLSFAMTNAFAEWHPADQNDSDSIISEAILAAASDDSAAEMKSELDLFQRIEVKGENSSVKHRGYQRSMKNKFKKAKSKSQEQNSNDLKYLYQAKDSALIAKLLKMHKKLNAEESSGSKENQPRASSQRSPNYISSTQLHSNKGRLSPTYNPAIVLQENRTNNERKKSETQKERAKDMFARLEREALLQNKALPKSFGQPRKS